MTWRTPAIRSEYRGLEPRIVLDKPVSVLLSVGPDAISALTKIGIMTVFDLAMSTLFSNAVEICRLAENRQGKFADTGRVPRDVLRRGHEKPVAELPMQDINDLASSTSEDTLIELAKAIGASSVHDLAVWPPYQTSRELFFLAFPLADGCGDAAAETAEAPPDLVPANGQYPTERVQYDVLLFDQYLGDASQELKPLAESNAIDVSALIATDSGYTRPAIGAVLTYTQSWYTKGLALGNLIHSIALGPGESTRIAMIDWSRRTRARATEEIGEEEALVSDLSRARAITEITSAVANETQRGQSAATNFAIASQEAESTGRAGIANPFPLGPLSPGVETAGTSKSRSTGFSQGTAWSTSSGHRDVAASLAQDIVDRTHQASHLARSRRASIVREVSQEESESVSTRAVTNYNHMHALTIQYYEVVQLYRTVVELSRADRCLFVPLRLVDFTNPLLVQRYKEVIAAVGLNSGIQALALADPARYAFYAPRRTSSWDEGRLANASRKLGSFLGNPNSPVLSLPLKFRFRNILFDAPVFSALTVTLASGETVRFPLEVPPTSPENYRGIAQSSAAKAIEIFGDSLIDVRRVVAEKSEDALEFSGNINTWLYEFSQDPQISGSIIPISYSVGVPKQASTVELFNIQPTPTAEAVTEHLQENRLYYSQAIWRSLDAAVIGSMLSSIGLRTGNGENFVPLVQLVDPIPVTLTANYLVLRLSGEEPAEGLEWLKERNITVGTKQEDLVPVPSGGVFAEAVLGRFNSAEKLDLTRFWNWQDSPIPITAPEIAPIATGSRGEPDDTKPGQLGQPVLNIVNAPALPDPQGMAPVLAAVQNGAMFRDMSGLAATIGLAQAGMAAAQQGATAAGAQAGENAAVAAEFGAKVAEIAGKLVAAYFSGGASLAAGAGVEGLAGMAGGISGQGAKVNYGRGYDARNEADSSPAPSPNGTGMPAGSEGNGSSPSTMSAGGSKEVEAFDQSLGGGGASGIFGQLLQLLLGASGAPVAAKPALTLGQKVPSKNETDVVGAIAGKIVRGTPDFAALEKNTNADIEFKDEEGTDADRMMTVKLRDKLAALAPLVKAEWPGKKLRVTEAWDESNEHAASSTHYEGRAADLTVSDKDSAKLGRLGQLAVDAGLDWVFYENSAHVHVSMKK
jgi:hypothetical protein